MFNMMNENSQEELSNTTFLIHHRNKKTFK